MFKIISLSLAVPLSLFIASCGTGNTTEKTETKKVVQATTYVTCRRIRPSPSLSSIQSILTFSYQVRNFAPGFPDPLSWMGIPCLRTAPGRWGFWTKSLSPADSKPPPN